MGAGHRPVAAQPHGRFSPSEIPTARLFRKVSSTTCVGVLRRSVVIPLPDLGVQRPALTDRSLDKSLVLFRFACRGRMNAPTELCSLVGAIFSGLVVLLDAFECEICSHSVGEVPHDRLAVSVHESKTLLTKAHQPTSSPFFCLISKCCEKFALRNLRHLADQVPPEVIRYCCFPSALPLTFRR